MTRKILYIISLIICIFGICLSIFAILNLSVSRKYEACDGCIGINGENLCLLQFYWLMGIILLAITFIVLIIKRKTFSNNF
jgi:hypothetical protein